VAAVPRRLIDPGPFGFGQLHLPHASERDLDIAQQLQEKAFPGVELTFGLWAVPTFELIESSFVEAVARRTLPVEAYEDWRRRGAPEAEARKNFADADAAQRRNPQFAEELTRVEALERLFAAEAPIDPLIAASLEVPVSTGQMALFVIDGRHRRLAAAATGIAELEVYIGKPNAT
jgi:hypothetical protein